MRSAAASAPPSARKRRSSTPFGMTLERAAGMRPCFTAVSCTSQLTAANQSVSGIARRSSQTGRPREA